MKLIFKLLLLLFLIPQVLFATDYYVRCSTGSNSNDGSDWTNALLTIQYCVDNASTADKCIVSNNETCSLSDFIRFNTGFTDNSLNSEYFILTGGDDGGSNTFTTPSGANVPVAVIDGGSSVDNVILHTGAPRYIVTRVKLQNFAAYTIRGSTRTFYYQVQANIGTGLIRSGGKVIDSEFTGSGSTAVFQHESSNSALLMSKIIYTGSGQAVYNAVDQAITLGNVIDTSGATGHGVTTQAMDTLVLGNTIDGNSTTGKWGIYNQEEGGFVLNNTVTNWDGTSGGGIETGQNTADGTILAGYNDFYNNTTDIDTDYLIYDAGNNQTESSDPLDTDFSLVSGTNAEDAALSIGGLLDIGAVESTESGGGGSTVVIPHGSIQ